MKPERRAELTRAEADRAEEQATYLETTHRGLTRDSRETFRLLRYWAKAGGEQRLPDGARAKLERAAEALREALLVFRDEAKAARREARRLDGLAAQAEAKTSAF